MIAGLISDRLNGDALYVVIFEYVIKECDDMVVNSVVTINAKNEKTAIRKFEMYFHDQIDDAYKFGDVIFDIHNATAIEI